MLDGFFAKGQNLTQRVVAVYVFNGGQKRKVGAVFL
jgi:hypothetical protein